jgi:hypothetical protein
MAAARCCADERLLMEKVMKLASVLRHASVLAIAAGLILATAPAASAHERRAVGTYTLVVGWLSEPAYLNQPNALDLRVSRTDDGSAVEGLERTLKAEATAEGKALNVELRPRFRTPGAYDGRLLPTAEGVFKFRITGTIEGNQVDETFTAGPSTFGLVEKPLAFPRELPSLTGIDQGVRGFEERILSLEEKADTSRADTAMALGAAGILVGVAGLVTAAFALRREAS